MDSCFISLTIWLRFLGSLSAVKSLRMWTVLVIRQKRHGKTWKHRMNFWMKNTHVVCTLCYHITTLPERNDQMPKNRKLINPVFFPKLHIFLLLFDLSKRGVVITYLFRSIMPTFPTKVLFTERLWYLVKPGSSIKRNAKEVSVYKSIKGTYRHCGKNKSKIFKIHCKLDCSEQSRRGIPVGEPWRVFWGEEISYVQLVFVRSGPAVLVHSSWS